MNYFEGFAGDAGGQKAYKQTGFTAVFDALSVLPKRQ